MAGVALNALTSAVLIYAAFHVHVDRTIRRQPVVTWLGPAAALGPYLGVIVLGLIVATFLASPALTRDDRVNPRAILPFFLTFLNMFGGLIFFGALFED